MHSRASLLATAGAVALTAATITAQASAPPASPSQPPQQINPQTILGSLLWAWGWAGANGQHVVIVPGPRGPLIEFLADLSGNGHHWFRYGTNQPGYQVGLDLPATTKGGAYQTSLPLIGLDKYSPPCPSGCELYGNVYDQEQSLNANGAFYLAVVSMNTRTGGTRELLGRTALDVVRCDQSRDNVSLTVHGTTREIAPDGTLPAGISLLEIWRKASGEIVCVANGNVVSPPGIFMPGVFALSGFGYDGAGTSQHDDYLCELVICDGLPTATQRNALRTHLSGKWGVQ